MDINNVAQVEIWNYPHPLRQEDWLAAGFDDLEHYVKNLVNEGSADTKRKYSYLPLVSFGSFDPKTGKKNHVLICKDTSELPTKDIEGILEFKKDVIERTNEAEAT